MTKRFTPFIELLDIHPDLAIYVKQLYLSGYNGFSGALIFHPQNTVQTFISPAISRLPSLKCLLLTSIRLDAEVDYPSMHPPESIELDAQSPKHLPKLWISGGDTTSWVSILTWFLSTYTVDTLQLSSAKITPLKDLQGAIIPVLDRLRNTISVPRLVIEACPNEWSDAYSLLEVLLRPGSLQAASLLCMAPSCATRVLRFMHVAGHNVTYVSFDITWLSVESDRFGRKCT